MVMENYLNLTPQHFFIVAIAFWFEEGGSVTYFDYALDSPLVGSGRNTTASLTAQGGVGVTCHGFGYRLATGVP